MTQEDPFARAIHLSRNGSLEAALDEYRRAIEYNDPTVRALIEKAILHRQMGELRLAMKCFTEAIELDPCDPWARLHMGILLSGIGRPIAAVKLMSEALDFTPGLDEIRINVVDAFLNVGWLDAAYFNARRLSPEVGGWWASCRRSAITRYAEKKARAISLLKERRKDKIAFSASSYFEVAGIMFEMGYLRIAAKLCRKMMRQNPASFPTFWLYARVIVRREGISAGIAFLESVSWAHEENPEYYLRLAQLQHEAGNFDNALKHLDKAKSLKHLNEARIIKATALLLLKRSGDLIEHCKAWMASSSHTHVPGAFALLALRDKKFVNFLQGDEEGWKPNSIEDKISERCIVQFWDADDVPSDVSASMETWIAENPEAKKLLFSNSSARAFIADNFDAAVLSAFDYCHHAAMKSDFFRVAFLYKCGGVYTDADEVCKRPIESIFRAAHKAEIIAAVSGDIPGYIHNFFIAAKPYSEILRQALEGMVIAINAAREENRKLDIWQVTGPGMITRAVGRYLVSPEMIMGDVKNRVILLSLSQYRSFSATNEKLAYKRTVAGNWRMA